MDKKQSKIYTESLNEIIANKVKVSGTLDADVLLWFKYVRLINGKRNKLDIRQRCNFGSL